MTQSLRPEAGQTEEGARSWGLPWGVGRDLQGGGWEEQRRGSIG